MTTRRKAPPRGDRDHQELQIRRHQVPIAFRCGHRDRASQHRISRSCSVGNRRCRPVSRTATIARGSARDSEGPWFNPRGGRTRRKELAPRGPEGRHHSDCLSRSRRTRTSACAEGGQRDVAELEELGRRVPAQQAQARNAVIRSLIPGGPQAWDRNPDPPLDVRQKLDRLGWFYATTMRRSASNPDASRYR